MLGEYILGLLPKGTHEYGLFISPETIEEYIGHQMTAIDTKGATVRNPLTMEMCESNNLKSNYMLIAKHKS